MSELGARRIGVLSAGGELGPHALPVQFTLEGLDALCLLPRWSELAYALAGSDRVVLVVLAAPESERRWVRYRGTASLVAPADWPARSPAVPAPDDRFHLIRIRPERIDLIDEERGWGARETLDLA